MQDFSTFLAQFTPIAFAKGEFLISADSDPSGVFFLASGFIRQFLITKDGQELTLHFFKPGSFLPLFWAVNNAPNRYTYQAFTRVDTILVPKHAFISYLKSNPQLLYDLSSRLLYGLEGMVTRVESLASANAKTRVVGILLFLGKHFGKKDHDNLVLTEKFTHQDIANLAGTTRETASRELEHLANDSLIDHANDHFVLTKRLLELFQ